MSVAVALVRHGTQKLIAGAQGAPTICSARRVAELEAKLRRAPGESHYLAGAALELHVTGTKPERKPFGHLNKPRIAGLLA